MYRMGSVESRFADIIWENEPLSSGALVKLCEQELEWKKSTTYTVLKKLCGKGLFRNADGIVSSEISKADYLADQGMQMVSESFGGSLPSFIAAFSSRQKLSDEDIEEIRALIDSFRSEA